MEAAEADATVQTVVLNGTIEAQAEALADWECALK